MVRRRFTGSRRTLRPMEWKASILAPQVVPGNTLFGGQLLSEATLDPYTAPTLMAIRGGLQVQKTTVGRATGVFGIIVQKKPNSENDPVSLSPLEDANAHWLFWHPFFLSNTSSGEDAHSRVFHFEIHAKSKRRLPGRSRLFFYYDTTADSTEYNLTFAVRALIKE